DLKAKERDLDDGARAAAPLADVNLRTLLTDRDRAAQRLDEAKKLSAKEDDPIVMPMAAAVAGPAPRGASRRPELRGEGSEGRRGGWIRRRSSGRGGGTTRSPGCAGCAASW